MWPNVLSIQFSVCLYWTFKNPIFNPLTFNQIYTLTHALGIQACITQKTNVIFFMVVLKYCVKKIAECSGWKVSFHLSIYIFNLSELNMYWKWLHPILLSHFVCSRVLIVFSSVKWKICQCSENISTFQFAFKINLFKEFCRNECQFLYQAQNITAHCNRIII